VVRQKNNDNNFNFTPEDRAAQLGVEMAGAVEGGYGLLKLGRSVAKLFKSGSEAKQILYHYTNEAGMEGIVSSGELRPSLQANNPRDVRYGEGQYLTDIVPGTKSPAQLAKQFINVPNRYKYTHYVGINVTGLKVQMGRDAVYVVPNTLPLNISKRIINYGKVVRP
jgi:hypothetical protein